MARYYKDNSTTNPKSRVLSVDPDSTTPAAAGDLILNKNTAELFVCTNVNADGETTWTGNLQAINDATNNFVPGIVAPEGKGIIGSIYSHDSWNNSIINPQIGNPSSSGPWTTYTNYNAYTDNSAIQFLNMALGDGYGTSGSSERMFGANDTGIQGRQLSFSNGNRVGHSRNLHYEQNNTSYNGYGFRMMPIRNTSNSSITVSLASYSSNYWSSGHEGRALFVFAPVQSGAKYSEVTSVNSTLVSNSSYSSNSWQTSQTGNYTIPANTTVIVCQTSTDWYYTTYQFVDTNYFYNLNTTFTNPSIICDMRMLSALNKSHFNMAYSGSFVSTAAKIWSVTASDFGDR